MIKKFNLYIIILFSSGILFSQEFPTQSNPPRLVNDFADFLTPEEENSLEQLLVTFNDSTSTQIAIVIIKSLEGYEVSDYAIRLAETWGIGQKDKNNGLVILVKPKINEERGQIFIATGYGLEDVIPDATANRIIDQEIIPYFKLNQNYQGLLAGTKVLMGLASKKFTASDYNNKKPEGGQVSALFIVFFIAIFVWIFSRGKRVQRNSIGRNVAFWTAASMLGSSGRGSFGNFSSGSSSFGGFGGGSFGGGGAGGSW